MAAAQLEEEDDECGESMAFGDALVKVGISGSVEGELRRGEGEGWGNCSELDEATEDEGGALSEARAEVNPEWPHDVAR